MSAALGFSLFECTDPDSLFAQQSPSSRCAAARAQPFGGVRAAAAERPSPQERLRHLVPLSADRTVVRASGSCACGKRSGAGTAVEATMRFEYFNSGGGSGGVGVGGSCGESANGSTGNLHTSPGPYTPLREREKHVCIVCPLDCDLRLSVEIDVRLAFFFALPSCSRIRSSVLSPALCAQLTRLRNKCA